MAKAIYIQEGKSLDFLNITGADIKYGDVVAFTGSIGVAETDIPKDGMGVLSVSGVYELPAVTTATFSFGQKVYWDSTASKVTGDSSSAIPCGMTAETKTAGTTTVAVKLG